MNLQELTTILNFIRSTPASKEGNQAAAYVLQFATRNMMQPLISEPTETITVTEPISKKDELLQKESHYKPIIFTQEEIQKMPKEFSNYFITHNTLIKYRIHDGLFQGRFCKYGIKVEAASKDFDVMKEKMITKISEAFMKLEDKSKFIAKSQPEITKPNEPEFSPFSPYAYPYPYPNGPMSYPQYPIYPYYPPQYNAPYDPQRRRPNEVLFEHYAMDWLANKKRVIKESTYKDYRFSLKGDLIPSFKNLTLADFNRTMLQEFFNKIIDEGKHRKAEKDQKILSAIFDVAKEDFGMPNPVDKIELPRYEEKHGVPLTKKEQKKLVDFCVENKLLKGTSALLVLMFFGLRRSELSSLKVIEKNGHKYLRVKTSKTRKGLPDQYREIPFTPVFENYEIIVDFEEAKTCSNETLFRTIKKILPKHHIHELRSTFITRAKESGVNLEVVMLWDGHKQDKDVCSSRVDRIYTNYSEEYIWQESRKVNYEI